MKAHLARLTWLLMLAAALGPSAPANAAAAPVEVDVVVYGGTSGGVVAAVQATRMGKSAVLVEPGEHIGGMSSGGLGWTDFGNKNAVGGAAHEFYQRVGKHYGKPVEYNLEPHVAEQVFNEWVNEAKVVVRLRQPLASVKRDGLRIAEITTEDGTVYRARVFIDATYEGDLMAKAGVSCVVGREAKDQYGESVAGIQGPANNVRAGKFAVKPDPYLKPGDPSSGLLPMIDPSPRGTIGAADKLIQSYNYRVCLTPNAANRIPIEPPADYDPAHFELLARWIEARAAKGEQIKLTDFLKYDPLPNDKYDFNNRWAISTDHIGGSSAYPEADASTRAKLAKEHENYLRGFFHFLATSPRVPEAVRADMSRFGLAKDEFVSSGNWPHQLYVREGRRMVSDFVMIEQHCRGSMTAPNPVSLGAYGVDIHGARRIVDNGAVENEGSNGAGVPRPYPIAYGAIVPKASECENLFVTFDLSASHVAFASIRMEPVFMSLSQAAGTAAALAIDAGVAVQKVDYSKLRERLLADKQVLEWTSTDKPAKLAPKAGAAADAPRESYDLVVYGGTPGGIATAVRAAREGLNVLLINRSPVVGGQLSHGSGVWDTLYDGYRSPIFQEVRRAIVDHYRSTYGAASPQLRAALPGPKTERFVNGRFEPSVAEKVLDDLLAREPKITVLRKWEVIAADRDGATLRAVTLRPVGSNSTPRRVTAKVFADATYEADLAAFAKVPCRVGREPREEFGEPHAGKVFAVRIETKDPKTGFPVESADGRLNLRYYHITSGDILLPESTGAGDRAVMASNFRFVLCTDPANRIMIEKPAGYDAAKMREQIPGTRIQMPNNKFSWNRPEPLPFKDRWAEADWAERDQMTRDLLDITLQKLWFLQHDESVPEADRAFWSQCGLPKDEFAGNGHVPWEIYMREGRRPEGRLMLTQHDFLLATGLGRAPIHSDSIAFTDWVIDVHACHPEKVRGSAAEGALILSRETRPGQVPYASLLPKGVDNLLIPVCVSCTHVAWGAVRLEPVWMQTGEAAALAASIALKDNVSPAQIDPDRLVRRMCELRSMVTFLNDADAGDDAPWVPAVQYFGTKGFFPSYDAMPDKPLTAEVARQWASTFGKLAAKEPLDVMAAARALSAADAVPAQSITATEFADLLKAELRGRKLDGASVDAAMNKAGAPAAGTVTRGTACQIAYEALFGKTSTSASR